MSESSSMADIDWSAPTGLTWRSITNTRKYQPYNWLAGRSITKHPLFVAKKLVAKPDPSDSWLAVGEYHPADKKHRFRLPIYGNQKPGLYYTASSAQVLCSTPVDAENNYQLAWVDWSEELAETQRENLFAAGFDGNGSALYVARAYCNSRGVTNSLPPDDGQIPSGRGFSLGVWVAGNSQAHIPFTSKCHLTSAFQVLLVRRNPEAKLGAPSIERRWQMLNAAYSAKADGKYEGRSQVGQLSQAGFTVACPSSEAAVSKATKDISYDFKAVVSFPEKVTGMFTTENLVEEAQNYLNVALLARQDHIISSERGVLLACRGTSTKYYEDYLIDVCSGQLPYYFGGKGKSNLKGQVHAGFYAAARPLIEDMEAQVVNRMNEVGTKRLYMAGHSKGGAMACIMAIYLAERYPKWDIEVYTYGAPKFGDADLVKYYSSLVKKSTCYIYEVDVVPLVPLTQENMDNITSIFEPKSGSSGSKGSNKSKSGPLSNSAYGAIASVLSNLFVDPHIKIDGVIQVSEEEVSGLLGFINGINKAFADTNPSSSKELLADASQKMQAALQSVSAAMDKIPGSIQAILGDSEEDVDYSELILLGLTVIMASMPQLQQGVTKNNQHIDQKPQELFYKSLLPEVNTFINNFKGNAGKSWSDLTNPYVFFDDIQWMIMRADGSLNTYPELSIKQYFQMLLEAAGSDTSDSIAVLKSIGDFFTDLIEDHMRYMKELDPLDLTDN